eukprot:8276717-Pyramimonas_sp.AAC.1
MGAPGVSRGPWAARSGEYSHGGKGGGRRQTIPQTPAHPLDATASRVPFMRGAEGEGKEGRCLPPSFAQGPSAP